MVVSRLTSHVAQRGCSEVEACSKMSGSLHCNADCLQAVPVRHSSVLGMNGKGE